MNVKFKNIRLLPTFQTVDIWVGKNTNDIAKCFVQRYGATLEYYKDELSDNKMRGSVRRITGTPKSEVEGAQKIVCVLLGFDKGVIAHEIIHVIFYLSKITGVQINTLSDEWVAYMTEYLFYEMTDYKTYKEYELPATLSPSMGKTSGV